MGASDIQEFTQAMGRGDPLPAAAPSLERIAVLGGGDLAQAIAASCLAEGAQVVLFTAYRREMEPLRSAGGVTIRGDGPIGTYQAGSEGGNAIRLTAELDEAVADADAIVVTGPVLKQRTYSMVLAGHLRAGQLVVLVPGRTFGALEAAWYLRSGGHSAKLCVAELGAPPFRTERRGKALHLTRTPQAPAGILPDGQRPALEALARYFPNIAPAGLLQSSFSDAGGIVEAVALMGGGPAFPDAQGTLMPGAEALPGNATFRSLLGERHLNLVERLVGERRAVAARFGVREIPATERLLDLHAGALRGEGARPIPADPVDVLRCAVMGSLVPLLSAARIAEVPVPLTQAMIEVASAAVGGDPANAGRRLDRIGLGADDVDAVRRRLGEAVERGF